MRAIPYWQFYAARLEPDMETLVNECYAEFRVQRFAYEDVELRKHVNWEKRHKLRLSFFLKPVLQ